MSAHDGDRACLQRGGEMVEVMGEIEAFEHNLSGTAKVGLVLSSAHGMTILIFRGTLVGLFNGRLVCIGHMKKIGSSPIVFLKCWGVAVLRGRPRVSVASVVLESRIPYYNPPTPAALWKGEIPERGELY